MSVLLVLLGAIAVTVLYLTLAANAEANHQDRVLAVPSIADERDVFLRCLQAAAGQSMSYGNDVRLYQNGDEIFPAMLEAIRGSRTTVHLSTYVYWAGTIPDQFASALADAARRGVVVRVVVDSEGASPMPRALVARMRQAGCAVARYRRVSWHDWMRYNHRTHRRVLVVDGTVGFTGGVGIADEWAGHGESPQHWRDTHIRVTGPIVAALQAAFADNWNQCTEELLLSGRDYPALSPAGDTPIYPVVSTPAGGASAAQRVMAACIAGATRTLHITNAYFVPTPAFVDALCAARARGVDVQVIVPGPYHDQPLVRRASRHAWPRLLASGVAIYEFQPTMIHAKTLAVDGVVTLVGSINFDPRSFGLNAECAALIVSEQVAAEMERVFAADLARCARVDAAAVARRPRTSRALDTLCYWFRAQL